MAAQSTSKKRRQSRPSSSSSSSAAFALPASPATAAASSSSSDLFAVAFTCLLACCTAAVLVQFHVAEAAAAAAASPVEQQHDDGDGDDSRRRSSSPLSLFDRNAEGEGDGGDEFFAGLWRRLLERDDGPGTSSSSSSFRRLDLILFAALMLLAFELLDYVTKRSGSKCYCTTTGTVPYRTVLNRIVLLSCRLSRACKDMCTRGLPGGYYVCTANRPLTIHSRFLSFFLSRPLGNRQ